MLKPLRGRVLVQVPKQEEVVKNGIILTGGAPAPTEGVVVAVGIAEEAADGRVIPGEVFVGDTIVFPAHSGQKVKDGDEEYLVFYERDIIATRK